MKIVILEGNAVNPGDLSWDCLNRFGQVTVYPRTTEAEAVDMFPRCHHVESVAALVRVSDHLD